MDNLGYLGVAYALIFVVLFVYILFIWRRQAELEGELRALETKLKTLAEGAPSAPPKPAPAR